MSLEAHIVLGVYFIVAGLGFTHSGVAQDGWSKAFSVLFMAWLVLYPLVSGIVFLAISKSVYLTLPFFVCFAPYLIISILVTLPLCRQGKGDIDIDLEDVITAGRAQTGNETRLPIKDAHTNGESAYPRPSRLPKLNIPNPLGPITKRLPKFDKKGKRLRKGGGIIERNDRLLKKLSIAGLFMQLLLLAIVNFIIAKEDSWKVTLMDLNGRRNFVFVDLSGDQRDAFAFMYCTLGIYSIAILLVLILASALRVRFVFKDFHVPATPRFIKGSVKDEGTRRAAAADTQRMDSNPARPLLINAILLYSAFSFLIAIGVIYLVTALMMFTQRGVYFGPSRAAFTAFIVAKCALTLPFAYAQLAGIQILDLLEIYNADLVTRIKKELHKETIFERNSSIATEINILRLDKKLDELIDRLKTRYASVTLRDQKIGDRDTSRKEFTIFDVELNPAFDIYTRLIEMTDALKNISTREVQVSSYNDVIQQNLSIGFTEDKTESMRRAEIETWLANKRVELIKASNRLYRYFGYFSAAFALAFIMYVAIDNRGENLDLLVPFTTIMTISVFGAYATYGLSPAQDKGADPSGSTAPYLISDYEYYTLRYPLTWLFFTLSAIYSFMVAAQDDLWVPLMYSANLSPRYTLDDCEVDYANENQTESFRTFYAILGSLQVLALIVNVSSMRAYNATDMSFKAIKARFSKKYRWYDDYPRMVHLLEISIYLDIAIWYILCASLLYTKGGKSLEPHNVLPVALIVCTLSLISVIILSNCTIV